MSTANLINKIIKNDLCIGCGLCSGISHKQISMKLEHSGFLIPTIENKEKLDINYDLINQCCPGINTYSNFISEKGFWGDIQGCYTGHSTNKKIRYAGSSGGAITGLLDYLLRSKLIDGVVQTGPNFDKSPFCNDVYFNTTPEDVLKCASSRYSPSSPLQNINELLGKNVKMAFVGKPCDITALRNLAKFDSRINEQVIYMISFFCAGLPSEIGSNNILKKMEVNKEDVISFKYRGNGWPGKTTATLSSKKKVELTYNEAWGKILGQKIHNRCKVCADSIGMSADIVAADAWYSQSDGYPDFEERDGRSLIVSRTEKGELLIQEMSKKGLMVIDALNENEIYAMQPGQVNKRINLLGRVLAIKSNPFQASPRYIMSNIYLLSKNNTKLKNIKSFLGMYKRIFKRIIK